MKMSVVGKYIKNGKIIQIPRKLKDKEELFDELIISFEDEVKYTEKEVNLILSKFYDDYAILRRYLVDYNYLRRDNDGRIYVKQKKE
jgi:hypothetical protein